MPIPVDFEPDPLFLLQEISRLKSRLEEVEWRTQQVYKTRSGYVGIGTSSPTAPLDVRGNLKVQGDAGVQGNLKVQGDAGVQGNLKVQGDVEVCLASNALDVYDATGSLLLALQKQEAPILEATFVRNSVAYKSDGTQVAANVPRYETGKFGQAVMVEEETTNLVYNASAEVYTGTNGLADGWSIGATSGITYSPSVSTSIHRSTGAKSQQVTVTGITANGAFVAVYPYPSYGYPASPGQTWTASAWMRLDNKGAAGWVSLVLSFRDSSGAYLAQFVAGPPVTIDNNGFGLYSVTATAPANTAYVALECRVGGNIGDTPIAYFDDIQLEQKPYPTSIIFANDTTTQATRSPETLAIPTTGVWNKGNWTVELIYIPISRATNRTSLLLIYSVDANNYLNLWVSDAGSVVIDGRSNGTYFSISSSAGSIGTTNGQYAIAASGNGATLKLYLNGNLVGSTSYAEPVGTASIIYVGCGVGGGQCNGLIDDLRISSRARTDAEIAAAYQSGRPLFVDEHTTCLICFDGNLLAYAYEEMLDVARKVKAIGVGGGEGYVHAGNMGVVSVDLPSIAANTTVDVEVPVFGLAVGDKVVACCLDQLEHGLVCLGARVKTAGKLCLRLANVTAAAIDGAARTWLWLKFV